MHLPNPYHRVDEAQRAIKTNTVPTDATVQALVDVIQGRSQNAALEYAWDKFQVTFERTVIESLLLADPPLEEIQRITAAPIAALTAYRDYIFDASVFRDRLERFSYVARLRGYIPKEQQAFLEAALTFGAEYIDWMLTHHTTVPPQRVLDVAMTDSYYMGLTHRGSDPTSERAKQAQRWQQTSVQAATTILRTNPNQGEDALANLRITLVHEDHVLTPKTPDAPRPEDIVH